MAENMRRCIDSKGTAAALLTDLSKAFDCINHKLLIAKLNTYGFGYNALKLIFDYLSRRRQRVKINDTLSKWSNIECGIPQGSILGPLLFNILINDIFYFMNNTKITNYADGNTPYICDKNFDIALNILESDGNTIFNWFAENFLKANANKSHLIVTKQPEGFSVTIGNGTIRCSAGEKLLGINIDHELKFENHSKHLCKKSNQKLLALSRMAPFINTEELKVLMRAFVNSHFGYCPVMWMFHSRKLNNCSNRIQEKALRITYTDNTSTFQELLTP